MLANGFPNAATPAGSTPYYVCRFSDAACRDDIAALFLWKKQLSELYAVSDPGVARLKLQWWQQQIQNDQQLSAHPLAAFMQGLSAQSESTARAIQDIIQAIDRHLHRQSYVDNSDMITAANTLGSGFARLLCAAANTAFAENTSPQAGLIIFTEWLQQLGRLGRNGIHILPEELLQQHQLTPDNLLTAGNKEKLQALLKLLVNDIEQVQGKNTGLNRNTPFGKYYRLRMALLTLLKKEQFAVTNQRISLTPLKKLWIAL